MIPQTRQNGSELRNNADFTLSLVKSICKGLKGLSNLGPKLWNFCRLRQNKANLCYNLN